MDVISSSSNPLIKQARALRQKKARDESGLFLIEGILHVGEAIEAGWQVDVLLYAPDLLKSDFAHGLVNDFAREGGRCVAVAASVFDALAEKENPQGIMALTHQRAPGLNVLSSATHPFLTAVVAPQDPGNVGAILRTMDAVGLDGLVLLDGGVDLYHPGVVRASMGTIFWKSCVRSSFESFLTWARAGGYRLVGTSARGTLDYRSAHDSGQPMVLLLGNEQKGLLPHQVSACDDLISLPMRGRASSLNLAVAAGVLLYALRG